MSQFQRDYWERAELDRRRAPTHPVVQEYVQSKIREIERLLPLTAGTSLLEVGCGNGFFTYHLARHCETTGVDFSAKMLALNPVHQCALMDANHLAFGDDSFDIVFCHAFLHHVEDIDLVLSEMRRVSRRYVVVLEPNRNNPLMFLFSLLVPEERAALRFSRGYLRRRIERSGLAVRAAFSHGMIVPNKTPTMLLGPARLINGRQPLGMTNVLIGEKT